MLEYGTKVEKAAVYIATQVSVFSFISLPTDKVSLGMHAWFKSLKSDQRYSDAKTWTGPTVRPEACPCFKPKGLT